MARGLPPLLVDTQAAAHAAPTLGNEPRVVNWLRAAAIVARIDPVAKGYLEQTPGGSLHVPGALRLEYQIHNLSDADFVNSVPAMQLANRLLHELAPRLGYRLPAQHFLNHILANLSAERIEILYSTGGLEAVEEAVTQVAKKP